MPHDAAWVIVQALIVLLAGVGCWHLAMLRLRREDAQRQTFERWYAEVLEAAHHLIDADAAVAVREARLMHLIGRVPAETSYQVIRRIGLGRQMEAAILLKLEALGVGERLPPDPAPQLAQQASSPVSRRAKLAQIDVPVDAVADSPAVGRTTTETP